MKVLTIASGKGGTGKTTVTAGLAGALREHKRFVALLDLDPTQTLSLVSTGVQPVTADRLQKTLRGLAGEDYVLIDTPPGVTPEVRTAIALSDGVIVPVAPEFLGLRGLGNILTIIPAGRLAGLVIVAYRHHVKHHQLVYEKIQGLGHPILAVVPFSIASADSQLLGTEITSYAYARSRGVSAAYRQVAKGVEKWARTG